MPDPRDILRRHNLPTTDAYDLPSSPKRFSDGGEYRIEIPSCEGPNAMHAVIEEAAARSVPIHRVSQGSGIMLQTDDEIRDMLAMGREHGIEVCLFVGPRANWDAGVQAASSWGASSDRPFAAPISSPTGSKTCYTAPASGFGRSSSRTSAS